MRRAWLRQDESVHRVVQHQRRVKTVVNSKAEAEAAEAVTRSEARATDARLFSSRATCIIVPPNSPLLEQWYTEFLRFTGDSNFFIKKIKTT